MRGAIRSLARESVGIALCCAIFVGASALSARVALPLPAGILGALVFAGAILVRAVPLSWAAPGSDRLLRHLGLFFVPAAVLALRQRALLLPALLPLAILIAISTTIGLVVAGVVTQWLARSDGPPQDDEAAAREEEPGT